MKCKKMLDVEVLKKLFYYDSEKGVLYHKVDKRAVHKGDYVGSATETGHLRTMIKNTMYYVHRIIWVMEFGSIPQYLEIDHINGKPTDNRLINLRLVTTQTNSKNAKKAKNNTSGCRGVCFIASRQKWLVRVGVDNERKFLGYYNTKDEAKTVRKQAEKKYDFHPNHGREGSRHG